MTAEPNKENALRHASGQVNTNVSAKAPAHQAKSTQAAPVVTAEPKKKSALNPASGPVNGNALTKAPAQREKPKPSNAVTAELEQIPAIHCANGKRVLAKTRAVVLQAIVKNPGMISGPVPMNVHGESFRPAPAIDYYTGSH